MQASQPEQISVAYITHMPTGEKCVYLSLVTDIYSEKIVVCHFHASLQMEKVDITYRRAIRSKSSMSEQVYH